MFGYASKIFPPDDQSSAIAKNKHMIAWNEDYKLNLLIDRYMFFQKTLFFILRKKSSFKQVQYSWRGLVYQGKLKNFSFSTT